MARRGQFGRRPRTAPSLTNTIVAIVREMQARRDANIMDAWKNGGLFEGSSATDERVLAYWRDRLAGVDKNDPLYDTYSNQVLQLRYAIAQSKADLAHVQGRMSDAAYANFFRSWARKVPRNSEFWRVLQKDAARLMESARSRSTQSAESARAEAFNNFSERVQRQQVEWGEQLSKALYQYAKDNNINVTADADFAIEGLERDIRFNPAKYAGLRRSAPDGWNGNLDQSVIAAAAHSATSGYARIANRAKNEGYIEAMRGAENGEQNMAILAAETKSWEVGDSVQVAIAKASRTLADPGASQGDKVYALDTLASTLTSLSATPGLQPGDAEALLADADRAKGVEVGEGVPGFTSVRFGNDFGINDGLAAQSLQWHELQDQYRQHPDQYTYASVKDDGTFDATGRGALGIVPRSTVPDPASLIVVPQANGQAISATMPVSSVVVKDPYTGKETTVGRVMRYSLGGHEITLYGYSDANGIARWTTQNPVSSTVGQTVDAKTGNIIVTPLPADIGSVQAAAAKAKQDLDTAIVARGDTTVENEEGDKLIAQLRSAEKVAAANLRLAQSGSAGAFEPFSVIQQSKVILGDIPGVTSTTTLGASMKASGTSLSYDQATALAKDENFQQDFTLAVTSALSGSRIAPGAYQQLVSDEWAALTTVKTPGDQGELAFSQAGRGFRPQDRFDLGYPGATVQVAAAKEAPTMGFGNVPIRLPQLPGAPAASREVLGPPAPLPAPLPTPTPTVTTTLTPTVTPTVTTVRTVTPTVTPTVQPTVTVAPTVKPPSYTPPPAGTNPNIR